MNINLSIYLPMPITGQQLIDAFSRVANENKDNLDIETEYLADSEAYALSAGPHYYGYGLKALCGKNFAEVSIEPKRRYVSFSLANAEIGGIVRAVNVDDSDKADYVREFRLKIITVLAEMLNISAEAIIENSKRLAGSGANDIISACEYCGAGFKVIPEVCPHCGAGTGKISPIY